MAIPPFKFFVYDPTPNRNVCSSAPSPMERGEPGVETDAALGNNRRTAILWEDFSMRLWHESLIPMLPRQQLLGQHRECCALRGNAWGRKHATVDYVFAHPPTFLFRYHILVMEEMKRRGYKPSPVWYAPEYRGKNCLPFEQLQNSDAACGSPVFPEHDERYLAECLKNLGKKGIFLEAPRTHNL